MAKQRRTRDKDIEVDVKNPRYEGATFEMVVKAMLQRPRKSGNPAEKTIRKADRRSCRATMRRAD